MRVLVTRPPAQSERLGGQLLAVGFQPLIAPMIDIQPLGEECNAEISHRLKTVSVCDGVIAISTNAVNYALARLEQDGRDVPKQCRWYAIGNATAKAMMQAGLQPVLPQGRFNTETLLELPDFQNIQGCSFVLLAGRDGRRMLEESLVARGAHVERIELYQRVPRDPQKTPVSEEPEVLTAMSGETLEALLQYMDSHSVKGWLKKPLFVPSLRIAKLAFRLGYQNVRVTANATENSLIEALSRFASEV